VFGIYPNLQRVKEPLDIVIYVSQIYIEKKNNASYSEKPVACKQNTNVCAKFCPWILKHWYHTR